MGDVNDTDALPSQVVYHFKKGFGFGLRKAARGFIHDQHTGIAGESLGDFHQLLFADGQISHEGVGGEVEANTL